MLASFLPVGSFLRSGILHDGLCLDIVQILTTAVVECQKAGMNNTAFNFAMLLMRPEYRDQIDAKYKKKIEMLVRKPEKSESDEDYTACPRCHQRVPDYELLCPSCQAALPYCIVTVRIPITRQARIVPF